ncbi:ATP-grasp domain-containing protein [Bacillus thuringiensis]|uniref:ATP-grasp domain-containing protein n=1 Tax=Bacillus thuringiensis TaxID=1428 RepID=UPI000BF47448|nr:ATP-grasp domain-containing protein [Bacillus thuringiensis]PES33299.1 hypothetical protein CN493_23785 [Bacillus thuringiensis]
MQDIDKISNKRVLLINRFPHWIYCDPNFFLKDVDELHILHSKESNFDFPKEVYTSTVICDFSNEQQVNEAVEYLYNNHKFNIVINLTERYIELAARIRDKFSIPGLDICTATKFRNKLEMKKVVHEAGLSVPQSSSISKTEDISNFINKFGKSVVKPIDGMGTKTTYVIEKLEDIPPSILNNSEKLSNFEIEQFISGQMFQCDSVVVDGEIKLCSISRLLTSTLHFEELGYFATVMIEEGPLRDKIWNFNKEVIEAFNFKNGVTHHELFLKDDGELVLCEIAARAGGGGTIPSIKYAYGINLYEADIRRQLQKELHFPLTDKKYAGFLIIHRKEGIVLDISSIDDFDFDWIYYKNINARRGDILTKADSSTASVADFTITGTSEADVIRKIEMIRKNFKLITE